MKIKTYLRDRAAGIAAFTISFLVIWGILLLFGVSHAAIGMVLFVMLCSGSISLLLDYGRRKQFYDDFFHILNTLDQKYLITEIIKNAAFAEGKILLEALAEIDRSMHEYLNVYKYNISEFKEYLEMWCHEIKTPIATIRLILENTQERTGIGQDTKAELHEAKAELYDEIDRIENYVEQVLYYVRSNAVESDYIVKKTDLQAVVNHVVRRNKKQLLRKRIRIEAEEVDAAVESDAKWLEFIINQIVGNSIKYCRNEDAYIRFYTVKHKNNTALLIEDNGIGIEQADLPKVFNKGFTGVNGRKKYNSTGIGLYLCRKLCKKLGHEILIDSVIDEKTTVTLIFPVGSLSNDVI